MGSLLRIFFSRQPLCLAGQLLVRRRQLFGRRCIARGYCCSERGGASRIEKEAQGPDLRLQFGDAGGGAGRRGGRERGPRHRVCAQPRPQDPHAACEHGGDDHACEPHPPAEATRPTHHQRRRVRRRQGGRRAPRFRGAPRQAPPPARRAGPAAPASPPRPTRARAQPMHVGGVNGGFPPAGPTPALHQSGPGGRGRRPGPGAGPRALPCGRGLRRRAAPRPPPAPRSPWPRRRSGGNETARG